MDEDKTNEEPETPTPTEDAGVQPSSTPFLDMANTTAERIEKAAKDINEAQDRREDYDSKVALGGRSEAGQEVKPKEETEEEFFDKAKKGEVDLFK